ncbi:MAG: hypothetical protein COA63_004180 [Methylophaga sp.]|nr:hypothetical protein [Methylophaga sp.]
MLDTVNLWLPQSQTSTAILNKLERVKESIKTSTGEVSFSGYLGNYQVSSFNHGISLKGSLAKYHLGDNFQTLSRQSAQEAIESLSDNLGIDTSKAEVKRVDIAENLIMKHQHQAYYDLLGECRRFKRLSQPKSIYYQNSSKQSIFYNKVAEGKHRGQELPKVWDNKQVLRYEYRFMKNPDDQLNMPVLTAQSLCDEIVYMKMIDVWYEHYQSINKIRLQGFTKDIMSDTKLLEKQLMLKGLEAYGGEQAFLELIDRANNEGKFDNRMQATRLRKKYSPSAIIRF